MEQGCAIEFKEVEVTRFCSDKELKVYRNILQDVYVGTNKNIKRCPTPDCDQVIRKPGCCCKRQGICTACEQSMCFRCGEEWHEGNCSKGEGSDWKNKQAMRHLLIANCVKC